MSERWTTADIPDQHGRTAVVTGANSGLGLVIATRLVEAGAHVVMACRNEAKAQDAAATITAGDPRGTVEVRRLDLGDLGSVAAFADGLRADHDRLDLLANNAGLMAVVESRTVDGFETQFGVNHLGHFALTGHLLPVMEATPGSRVVTHSSVGHRPGRVDLDDPDFDRRRYRRWSAYFQSKLANLLFALELQRRLAARSSTTTSLAAHPGYSHTELGIGDGGAANKLNEWVAGVVAMPAEKGALPFLRAATDPSAAGGTFWGPRWLTYGRPVRETPSRRARDHGSARGLWDLSERLTGVRYPT